MSNHESGGEHGEPVSSMESQLDPVTKISHDYRNEFSVLSTIISIFESHSEDVSAYLKILRKKIERKGRAIRLYEERCLEQKFPLEKAVNDVNRDTIKKIDELAEKCNQLFVETDQNPNLNSNQKMDVLIKEVKPLLNEIDLMIGGKNEY